MRIVIDMQGAQCESRYRGIGRLTQALAQAIVRERGEHEVMLAVSGLFPKTIEPIRAAFDGLVPQGNIRVWYAPGPTREADPANQGRREIAERVREAFLLSLQPDVVLIGSLFEGLGDDTVTSVGLFDAQTPTATILYDLIPLLNPDIHFRTSILHKEYYRRKIESLKRCKRLLSISESARREALSTGWFSERDVVNISAACDSSFRVLKLEGAEKLRLAESLGICRPFVMYTGGGDERKNLPRLIEAYAALPQARRDAHQLVMVGRMPDDVVTELQHVAAKSRLTANELVFTGYVSDTDLIKLYNSCKLFVFPSKHEGFGLPPLEAMACGAPVIVSNATSLPEVVGREDATFDPESTDSITRKMDEGLRNEEFRSNLIRNGLVEARKFSWERSARKVLEALKDFDPGQRRKIAPSLKFASTSIFRPQKKRILLLKLDHMGDLMLAVPAISKLRARYPDASLEAVVGSWNISCAKRLKVFDKIHVFDYFRQQSALAASATEEQLGILLSQLGTYDIAIDLRRQADTRFVLARVAAALKVGYQSADQLIDSHLDIALVSVPDVAFETTALNKKHVSAQMIALIDALPQDVNDYVGLPILSEGPVSKKRSVAIFPKAGNEVKEWPSERYWGLAKMLADEASVEAINVYFARTDELQGTCFSAQPKIHIHVGQEFSDLVRSLAGNVVCVSNNSFGAHLASYLGVAVVGIYGGHETVDEWAPVFGDSFVIHRNAHCAPCHIARREECKNGFYCLSDISVRDVHGCVMEAVRVLDRAPIGQKIELSSVSGGEDIYDSIVDRLLVAIAALEIRLDEKECVTLAGSIAASIPRAESPKQLFVDISQLVHDDARTGIQRVTRSILRALQENPPDDYVVVPVYAVMDRIGYFHAGECWAWLPGEGSEFGKGPIPIEYKAGDIFLGLDLQPDVVPAQRDTLQEMRRLGVKVVFVVYDLLCVRMPQKFPRDTVKSFGEWLRVVAATDGALCISRATADDLAEWVKESSPPRLRPLKIGWFHIGGDIENSVPTMGVERGSDYVVKMLRSRASFLIVGTLEPRKGHAQALDAFERLWAGDVDVNLVVVGKRGWDVDELIKHFRGHSEWGRRLFWLEGISDEYLEKVYEACTCLIAASEGEGFGLPLVEAARHSLAILARDLPVFREVAGPHAYYFSGFRGEDLAEAMRRWLALFEEKKHPRSYELQWLTWEQSAKQMVSNLLSM